ncbi:superoxide dismutase [Streptomyces solincola]|uniref:Superoxide dismutase n=1 Tax=Streptomyces solincola TaxID=2100817 RepID=A0A2S9Q1B9_9ACTN|nr:superoxide dismutase [Streptomyces solincola]PRH80469.1 superoxide dismutase [Streptomyces solincola]
MEHRTLSRRGFLGLGAALGGAVALDAVGGTARAAAGPRRDRWPTTLRLPNGFHPAGIAVGRAPYAYFGSLLGGAVHRVSLATGEGTVLHPGLGEGHNAVGLQVDAHGRLFVAGGWGRVVTVLDGATGAVLRTYQVGAASTAVNHVVVTARAAWFTDAFNGLLFGVPFGPRGELPAQDAVVTLPLSGDWVQGTADQITATGIAETPDRRALLVVNSSADGGTLYRVDPADGTARRVALGGLKLPTTNGIAVHGRTLYAPRQYDLAVVRLDRAGGRGRQVGEVADPRFDVPCAVAVYRDRLYLPNSRFPLDPTPDTEYNAIAIPVPGKGIPS